MPYRGTLSNKKIGKILKFYPKYNLETGVKKLIGWYKSKYKNELQKKNK